MISKAGRYDLVIFDRIAPPKSLPPGGYLLIDTACAQACADLGAEVQRPTVIDSNRKHPASQYVDFSEVRIAQARYLKPKGWAVPIIDGEKGALGAAGANGGRRFVQVGFDLLQSDFPLHVGFPIFVANCLDWLAPANNAGAGDSIRTGQAAYIDVPPDVRELTVTDPAGEQHAVKVTGVPVIYEETERAGIYQVTGKRCRQGVRVQRRVAAGVRDRPEDSRDRGQAQHRVNGQGRADEP